MNPPIADNNANNHKLQCISQRKPTSPYTPYPTADAKANQKKRSFIISRVISHINK